MKVSRTCSVRGLWDELNQGLFPWIDDNIGELDAAHRLFMAVCEAVIKLAQLAAARVPHLFDLADAAYDAEPIRAACAELGTVAVIDANPRRSAEARTMGELEREVYKGRTHGSARPLKTGQNGVNLHRRIQMFWNIWQAMTFRYHAYRRTRIVANRQRAPRQEASSQTSFVPSNADVQLPQWLG